MKTSSRFAGVAYPPSSAIPPSDATRPTPQGGALSSHRSYKKARADSMEGRPRIIREMKMSSVMAPNVTFDAFLDALRKSMALNQNDMDATLQYLGVSPEERASVKTKLEGVLRGDSKILAELEESLASGEKAGLAILAASGGVTKYEVLKHWGVPYGERLYVSHQLLGEALDIGTLIAAVAAVCGKKGESLAAGLTIGLAALQLMDRGNGVKITRIPMFSGPCVPLPQ
jgi:hypothetical protein